MPSRVSVRDPELAEQIIGVLTTEPLPKTPDQLTDLLGGHWPVNRVQAELDNLRADQQVSATRDGTRYGVSGNLDKLAELKEKPRETQVDSPTLLGLPSMVRGRVLSVGREGSDEDLALPDITEAKAQASLSPSMSYAVSEDFPGAYMVAYRVKDLYDLAPSHTEMSPADQERVAAMARDLPVDALVEDSQKLRQGAPVVGGDLLVESGNGWVRALRLARRDVPGQWREYYAAVDKQAAELNLHDQFDAAASPVLVRERLTPVPNRADFMAEANVDGKIGFNPTDEVVDKVVQRITRQEWDGVAPEKRPHPSKKEEGDPLLHHQMFDLEGVPRTKPEGLITKETIEKLKSKGRRGRKRTTRKALFGVDPDEPRLLPDEDEQPVTEKPRRKGRRRVTTDAAPKPAEAVEAAKPKSQRKRKSVKPDAAPPPGPEAPPKPAGVLPAESVGPPPPVQEDPKEREPEVPVEAGTPLAFIAGEDAELPSVKEARRDAAGDQPLTWAFSERFPKFAYMLRYRVVDLADLITSHNTTDSELVPNSAFPKEIQPRIRERLGSRAQVWEIAKDLIPEQLTNETNQIRAGTPIIGGDMLVESGNGRILALRMAQEQAPEGWSDYKDEVELRAEELGIADQLEGVEAPVLVRERVTPVNRVAFAREANDPDVLTLSPVETALKEADAIPDNVLETLDSFEGEEADASIDAMFRSPRMQAAVVAYIRQLPKNTWNELVTKDGKALNRQGKQRFKAALFAKVYDGENGVRLAETFLEDDDASKNIENALFNTLRQTAQVKAGIRQGRLPAQADISEDIIKVVDKLVDLKANSLTVEQFLAQGGLQDEAFGEALTPLQKEMLVYFDENKRSAKRIKQLMYEYAERASKAPPPDQGGLLGPVEPVTKEKLFADSLAAVRQAQSGATDARELERLKKFQKSGFFADPEFDKGSAMTHEQYAAQQAATVPASAFEEQEGGFFDNPEFDEATKVKPEFGQRLAERPRRRSRREF